MKLYLLLVTPLLFNLLIRKQSYTSLAFVAGLNRATDEGSLPEIVQYSPYFLSLNVFTASKGSNHYILLFEP